MTALSDYLRAHTPAGWAATDLVAALDGKVGQSTVYKYLAGSHAANPPEGILQAFAGVLDGASIVEMRLAAGLQPGLEDPWRPPEVANRLSLEQRRALDNLILATAAEVERAAHRADQEPTPAASELPKGIRAEVQAYLDELKSRGGDQAVADRLEAALTQSSASDVTNKSSSE